MHIYSIPPALFYTSLIRDINGDDGVDAFQLWLEMTGFQILGGSDGYQYLGKFGWETKSHY